MTIRLPNPIANTTTEAYLAYKAGVLKESELKPILYYPNQHFDAWLAYWCGLVDDYPIKGTGKNIFDKNNADVIVGTIAPAGYVTRTGTVKTLFVQCKSNTTYTIQKRNDGDANRFSIGWTELGTTAEGNIPCYDREKDNDASHLTITTGATAQYIAISFWSSTETSLTETQVLASIQVEEGSEATSYEPYHLIPEMLCDEEAYVAYLSKVTDTYPEEIKDPYDVRRVGYLRAMVSSDYTAPDYPVNNEELYLSMISPAVTNPTPSSSFTLKGTGEGPFESVEVYGDIHQWQSKGINLIDTSDFSSSYPFQPYGDDNGFILTKGSIRTATFDFPNPLAAGTYTLSCDVVEYSATKQVGFAVRSESGTLAETSVSATGEFVYTFTTTEAIHRLYVYMSSADTDDATITFDKFQIEAGDQATPYEDYTYGKPEPNPDNPINPDVVTGDQVVNISGKNLYYQEQGVNTFTGAAALITATFGLNETTVEAITDRNGAQYAGGIIGELDPNKTYVLSGEVEKLAGTHGFQVSRWYSDNGSTWQGSTIVASGELVEGEKAKFSTTVTGHRYYRFAFWNANVTTKTGVGEKTHHYNLQLEEGTEPTSFAPYKAPVQYPLSLGSIRLLKMGDYSDKIYQDDEGDWYIHKAINIATFDGSPDEEWYKENTGNPNFMYCLDDAISDLVYVSDSEGFMSNIEVPAIINSSTTNDGISLTSSGSIRFRYYPEVSLDDIKAFLSFQNLDIYYATTNPVDTKITDTTLISQLNAIKEGGSYKGDTIVLVTNSGEYLTALLKLSATIS